MIGCIWYVLFLWRFSEEMSCFPMLRIEQTYARSLLRTFDQKTVGSAGHLGVAGGRLQGPNQLLLLR